MTLGYVFIPRWKYITGITNAQYAVVTCDTNHNFSDGEYVSFRVSHPYGMSEINDLQAQVLSHTDDTITVDIDSSTWNNFIYPVSGKNTPPVVVPAGSGIIPNSNPPTVNLQDAFDNIRTF